MKKIIVALTCSPLARGVAGGTRRGVAKRFIVAVMLVLCAFGARAENEPAATSKEYVDSELAIKQPTIPAQGNNVVMTFDSTATDGIGTKAIYDESASYASQQNALVTAGTANAAVQMAIQGEFYCKEYSNIDPTDCWLWGIRNELHNSPNLLCTPASATGASFDSQTSIMSNTVADTRNYIMLYIFTSPVVSTVGAVFHGGRDFSVNGAVEKWNFTTNSDTNYLYIKHNGASHDFRLWFPVEPSTEYTFVAKALNVDPTTVGGMQMQIMLVPGNYTGDEIIPCGQNIYVPQNVQ